MPRVIHFEIHAHDPERAVAFYRAVFGWEVRQWDGPVPYWLISTGAADLPGINGALMIRRGPPPVDGQAVNAYVCTLDVPDIDAYLERARAHGATLALDKMAVPGVGWMAYCKDTEGNVFGMMQEDPTAA